MEALCAAVKNDLMNNDTAAAAAKIQQYSQEQHNTPLNIAITGETGVGKSSFVNAFRGIKNQDEGAAATGITTTEVTPCPHPDYPNVTLWDLPGIGTIDFPADKYLQCAGFEKFDFFFIISADRFRENDVKLAQEIQKMKKKFYFVRSKIDENLRAAQRKKNFSKEGTLTKIWENCVQGLRGSGIESPQVFLVSSFELHLYDFPLLQQTLERELPDHKRHALLLAMSNINLEIINKKKKDFQAKIKYQAALSAAGAAVPIPGLSFAVDLILMVSVIKNYVAGFGLDKPTLEKCAAITGVTYTDLCAVIKSDLVKEKITRGFIMKLLISLAPKLAGTAALLRAEKESRCIPIIVILKAMSLSFITTYITLNYFLSELADDDQRVFQKALGLKTSV